MAATQTSQGTLGLRDPYCRAPGKFSRRDFPRGGFHAKILLRVYAIKAGDMP